MNSIRTGSSSNSGISSSGSSSSSSNSSGRNISGSNSSGRNISPSNSSDSLTKAPKSASKPKRKVSAEQAIALVKKRADVKKFLALFPNGKSQATRGYPVVDVEELDNNWNVHVYEQTPEHTATMNWFEVNSQTGSIKPMTD